MPTRTPPQPTLKENHSLIVLVLKPFAVAGIEIVFVYHSVCSDEIIIVAFGLLGLAFQQQNPGYCALHG